MPVRPSMSSLISRIRLLISDVDVANQIFSDQVIQDTLDTDRQRVSDLLLSEVAPGVHIAPLSDWETDVQLLSGSGATLTPTDSNLFAGEWTIATPNVAVYLSGKSYDLYAAAAALLEAWAAQVKLHYDVATDDQKLARSQQRSALLELAAQYRARTRPRVIPMVRSDA
jgi:hypothetical protein